MTYNLWRRCPGNTLTLDSLVQKNPGDNQQRISGRFWETSRILKMLLDSLGTSDSTSRYANINRTLSDAITKNDTFTRVDYIVRICIDSITDTASLIRARRKTLVDSLNASETLARAGIYKRGLSEVAGAADDAGYIKFRTGEDYFSFFDASIDTSDSLTRQLIISRTFSNTLSESDIASKIVLFRRSLADSMTASDTRSRAVNFTRTYANILSGNDVYSRVVNFTRQMENFIDILDVSELHNKLIRRLYDVVNTADIESYLKTGGVAYSTILAEVFALESTYDRGIRYMRGLDGALALSDLYSRSGVNWQRVLAQPFSLYDIIVTEAPSIIGPDLLTVVEVGRIGSIKQIVATRLI